MKNWKNAKFLLNNMVNWREIEKMQHSYWITWKVATKASNMPSKDVWKFTSVSTKTSTLWGRSVALTPLLPLITPSRASGTADHVQSLDDLLSFILAMAEIRLQQMKLVDIRHSRSSVLDGLGELSSYGWFLVASGFAAWYGLINWPCAAGIADGVAQGLL